MKSNIHIDNRTYKNLVLSSSTTTFHGLHRKKFTNSLEQIGKTNIILSGEIFSVIANINENKIPLIEQITILQIIIYILSIFLIISLLSLIIFRKRFIEHTFIRYEKHFVKRFIFYVIEVFFISLISNIIGETSFFIVENFFSPLFHFKISYSFIDSFLFLTTLLFAFLLALYILFDYDLQRLSHTPTESEIYNPNKFLKSLPIFILILLIIELFKSNFSSNYINSFVLFFIFCYIAFFVLSLILLLLRLFSTISNLIWEKRNFLGFRSFLIFKVFGSSLKRQVMIVSIFTVFLLNLLVLNGSLLYGSIALNSSQDISPLTVYEGNNFNSSFDNKVKYDPTVKNIVTELSSNTDLGTANYSFYNYLSLYGINSKELKNFYSKEMLNSWGENFEQNIANLTGVILNKNYKDEFPLGSIFTIYYYNSSSKSFESIDFTVQGFINEIFNQEDSKAIILPFNVMLSIIKASNSFFNTV